MWLRANSIDSSFLKMQPIYQFLQDITQINVNTDWVQLVIVNAVFAVK